MKIRPISFFLVGSAAGCVLGAPTALVARAEVYMSAQQAALSLLPGVALQEKKIDLSPAEIQKIQSESGEEVRDKQVDLWAGPKGEAVIIDRVVGKHDFITYAVALDGQAKVKGIEILEYRETYGSEIRRPAWRQQFVGKGPHDAIKLEKDIKNISGATLSSAHVSAGVRRVVHTYEAILARK